MLYILTSMKILDKSQNIYVISMALYWFISRAYLLTFNLEIRLLLTFQIRNYCQFSKEWYLVFIYIYTIKLLSVKQIFITFIIQTKYYNYFSIFFNIIINCTTIQSIFLRHDIKKTFYCLVDLINSHLGNYFKWLFNSTQKNKIVVINECH